MKRPEFTRRFNEVVGKETNSSIARRLGCTQGFISWIKRGHYVFGPELLARFVREYGLQLTEWQILAGHLAEEQAVEEADRTRLAGLAAAAAEKVALAINGAQRLAQGLYELGLKWNRPIPVSLRGGAATLTVEEADRILAEIDRQMAEEAQAVPEDEETPIKLEPPRKGRRPTH